MIYNRVWVGSRVKVGVRVRVWAGSRVRVRVGPRNMVRSKLSHFLQEMVQILPSIYF